MSWNKNIFKKVFNRSAQKDENQYWLDLTMESEDEYLEGYYFVTNQHYDFWSNWYIYGTPKNMGEYHQLKLLTLLRSFRLRSSSEEMEENGWT